MKTIRKLFFSFLFVSVLFASAKAQDADYELKKGDNEFSFWGSGSPTSNNLIGKVENARLGIINFRYARVIKSGKHAALKWTIDGVPAAFLSFPTFQFTEIGPDTFAIEQSGPRKTYYGAGAAPIGLQLNFRNGKKVHPFVNGSGGFLVFNKKIPDEDLGARFNFTYDFGGGFQVWLRDRKALTFGYKYYHISNAGRAPLNPGFDSNLFYFGFSVFK